MIPTFVINLDRRPDRLAFMAPQLDAMRLDWTRVSAVDAATASDAEISAEVALSGHRIGMGRGSMCCAITNFRIWRMMVEEDIPAALILQDDVALSPLIGGLMQDSAWGPPGIGVVQFERFGRLGSTRLTGPALGEPVPGVRLHRLFSRTAGAGAYLVTRTAAALMLAEKPLLRMPIDHFLFSPNVSPVFDRVGVALTLPALAIQRDALLASDLAGERVRRARTPAARLSRLWSEVNRAPRQLAEMAGGARWRPFGLHPSVPSS